ncbi:MAG: hypothetical protein HYX67_11985 [Candidatus Melainabacteria bacterium]|nr:hypothetical protein [Candidatus Melainabacteria bacterium]
MIECPICHVMNEEQAHFCSECGQRFAPAAPQPTFQNPNASAPDPVFPSFPPADKPQFQQPQAVQDYQQSSNFGAPVNQFDNAPATSPPPQDFGNPPAQPQQPAFSPPQTPAFNPPQTPAFSPPQQSAPPSFDAPQPGFNPPQPGFNPSQPGFNQPKSEFNPPQPGFNPPSNFNSSQETPTFNTNTSQEVQSKTFPPEPEASSTPPLPARPKLHSPLFDGPDEPDTRHQQPPKSGGFAGLNKPKGLRSPLLGEDDSEAEPPKPRSGGLRSPLLRGEDDPDASQRGKGSQRNQILPPDNDPPAPTSNKGKGGLRSPLLGAADDDFLPQPKPVRPPKGLPASRPAGGSHLRSPLLGGVDDYEGDDDDDDLPPVPGKTAFPHRRPAKDTLGTPDSSDQTSSGKFPGKSGGLRSPLLGGSDVDDAPVRPSGGIRPRLHSPIMDGPGSQNFEAEYDEPYYEEIDDPNVLRSPLLAARSKHVAPVAPKAPVAPESPAAKVIPPQAPPVQPPAPAFPATNSFAEPSAPSAQPEFRDRSFPAAPQPPGDMWRERGFSESRVPEPKAVTPTPIAPSSPPEVASNVKESSSAPTLRRSSRSGLLGGAADDIDEQPINNYRNSPPSSPMPAMLLMICCVVSIPAKLWYMSIMSQSMMANPGFLFEEVMQLLLLGALIFFAASAAKR